MKEEEIFSSAAFPLIKRVMTKMISSELVKVMPMSAPTGIDFLFDTYKKCDGKSDEQINKEKDLEDFYDEHC